MKEIKIEAKLENLTVATDFVDNEIAKLECPMKIQFALDIAIDEIVSNIINHGYQNGQGDIWIRLEFQEGDQQIKLTFIDEAPKYNPLEAIEPDTSLEAEERSIGGLGIFLVKKSMDDMIYNYEGNRNMLTIIKSIS